MKISPGLGGRGSVVSMEQSKPHPANHFEPDESHVRKMDDGTFSIRHEMKLKKKHQGKEGFHGSYPDPKTATAPNAAAMVANLKKHFGGGKMAMAPAMGQEEPDADDE
jgi:hypothetical protein